MSLQNNRYPVELAGELKRHVIVKVDRRAAVLAYIKTFLPDDGAGDCALADALKTHINASVNATKMSFVFMMVRMRLAEIASLTM
jgi:hypothetical protein